MQKTQNIIKSGAEKEVNIKKTPITNRFEKKVEQKRKSRRLAGVALGAGGTTNQKDKLTDKLNNR